MAAPTEAYEMTDAGITWTDDRVEQLKKLWSDGLSASQMQAKIGGVTRNTVIGKVHGSAYRAAARRSGELPASRKVTRSPSAPTPITQQPAPRNGDARARPGAARHRRPAEDGPRRRRGDPHVGARHHHGSARVHVPLAHGRPDQAGIPILRRAFGLGMPYCNHHARVAYQPIMDRKRDRRLARA